MWKSLEERDTTGKYKQAREMAELGIEQLEYAYNSGYADAKSKYERPQGEWEPNSFQFECNLCENLNAYKSNFCPNCGAKMKKGGAGCG